LQYLHTFFCRVDSGHWTERAFSLVVVDANFDLVWGERRDALILEDVSGSIWRCDSCLHPALCAEWAESHHISKARTTLQLLWDRLGRYEMIHRDYSRGTRLTHLKNITEIYLCTS